MADQPDKGGRGLVKEQEDAAKEAFDGTAQALFLFGPSGGKHERFFCRLGWKANNGDCVQGGMDPGDEPQAPIGGVQANNARTDAIEAHGPCQQRASKRGIMDEGLGKQKEEG